MLAVLAQMIIIPPWTPYYGLSGGGVDFRVYRAGAHAVLDGQPLYGRTVLDFPRLQFTYPPFAALCFIPWALLPLAVGKPLALCSSFALLAVLIGRTLAATFRLDRRLLALSLALAVVLADVEPVWRTLWFGQVNLVLMALVLLDLARAEGSRGRGVGVGLAAGIKLTALVFLPYLLVTKQWRAAAWASGTFAATILISWLLLPRDWAAFWCGASANHAIGETRYISNQAVSGLLARLWWPQTAPPALWPVLALVVGVCGTAVAAWAHHRREPLLAVALVGLTGCAVSPISWSHHWVWFAPFVGWLVARAATARRRAGRIVPLAGACALVGWLFIWTISLRHERDGVEWTSQDPGIIYAPWWKPTAQGLFSDWYLAAWLAAFAGSAFALRYPPTGD